MIAQITPLINRGCSGTFKELENKVKIQSGQDSDLRPTIGAGRGLVQHDAFEQRWQPMSFADFLHHEEDIHADMNFECVDQETRERRFSLLQGGQKRYRVWSSLRDYKVVDLTAHPLASTAHFPAW